MAKNIIVHNKIITPRVYFSVLIGIRFRLNPELSEAEQVELIDKTINEQLGKEQHWSYALDDIEQAVQNGHRVVLVEFFTIVYQTMGEDYKFAKRKKYYRWLKVPASKEWPKQRGV